MIHSRGLKLKLPKGHWASNLVQRGHFRCFTKNRKKKVQLYFSMWLIKQSYSAFIDEFLLPENSESFFSTRPYSLWGKVADETLSTTRRWRSLSLYLFFVCLLSCSLEYSHVHSSSLSSAAWNNHSPTSERLWHQPFFWPLKETSCSNSISRKLAACLFVCFHKVIMLHSRLSLKNSKTYLSWSWQWTRPWMHQPDFTMNWY